MMQIWNISTSVAFIYLFSLIFSNSYLKQYTTNFVNISSIRMQERFNINVPMRTKLRGTIGFLIVMNWYIYSLPDLFPCDITHACSASLYWRKWSLVPIIFTLWLSLLICSFMYNVNYAKYRETKHDCKIYFNWKQWKWSAASFPSLLVGEQTLPPPTTVNIDSSTM